MSFAEIRKTMSPPAMTTNGFAAHRRAMIEGQVLPHGVRDERVVGALAEVPREDFVPENMRGIAYVDEDLKIAPGRYLMEPRVFARLLQAVAPLPSDVVLDVGCGSGYSAAVLARLAGTVVALESDQALAAKAAEALTALGADNAAVVTAPLAGGYPDQAPYDVIFVSGAVEEVPEALLAQLAEDGRLIAVVGRGLAAQATLFTLAHGRIGRRPLFDAALPLLPGFERAPGFAF